MRLGIELDIRNAQNTEKKHINCATREITSEKNKQTKQIAINLLPT